MLIGNKQLYEQARGAKLGDVRLPEPLGQLRLWIQARYSVNVLHVVYDTIDIGPHEGRPRLELILETANDCAALRADRFTIKQDVKGAIVDEFAALVAATATHRIYDTRDIHVVLTDFSEEAMRQAVAQFLEKDRQRVVDEFRRCGVWEVSGFSAAIVVFYLSEEMRQRNQRNGCDDAIKQRCFESVRKYDDFGYFAAGTFPITFDSKENLDRAYSGSLFNYFR